MARATSHRTTTAGLRIFASAAASQIGRPVLPMAKEDRQFWHLFHTRRAERIDA